MNLKKNEIAKRLEKSQRTLIMTHLRPDGDAIGSSFALAGALLNQGKEVRVLSHDPLPYDVTFLPHGGVYVDHLDGFDYDLVVALDCSDPGRLEDRKTFLEGYEVVNIDHHRTNTGYGSLNWVEPGAGATGEMIHDLLQVMDVTLDHDIAQALYVAIATDTGHFMYSNTTRRTHEIVAGLMDTGIDVTAICQHLYQSVPAGKFRMDHEILSKATFHHAERLGVACVGTALMQRHGCDNTDNIVEAVRNIEGVDVAMLLVEREGAIKVSLRSKAGIDISEIALSHGGGGHANAAGFSMEGPLDHARETLVKEFVWLEERNG